MVNEKIFLILGTIFLAMTMVLAVFVYKSYTGYHNDGYCDPNNPIDLDCPVQDEPYYDRHYEEEKPIIYGPGMGRHDYDVYHRRQGEDFDYFDDPTTPDPW